MNEYTKISESTAPPVYIVSGNVGTVGDLMVRTILAQFQDAHVPMKLIRRVHHRDKIEEVVSEASKREGVIVHTLVDPNIRYALIDLCREQEVVEIDMVGPLLEYLARVLDQKPLGKPGLYRRLHKSYFKRIEAIEFTMAHDDGKNYKGWKDAEIVLAGVSRVGKTPLSIYLSMLGWQVANIPLVADIPPNPELFKLDRRRVVGLTIDPTQLLDHRKHRQKRLGVRGESKYADPIKLYEELKEARRIFRRGGFRFIDVTHKPIETTADEVVKMVTRQLKINIS